jgi:hypothetical protein
VRREWQDVIDGHGTLAYGAKANGRRVSQREWLAATSGATQATWQRVANALQQREPLTGDFFAEHTVVQTAYVVNSTRALREWLQRRVPRQEPPFNVELGLDMAFKLQRYWACRLLDSAAYQKPDAVVALWSANLLELSAQPLPEGFADAPAVQGIQALVGTSRIDRYGRDAGPRRAVWAFGMDGYLALGTEYAAPVMVGLGSNGTQHKPNLTLVLVAENEARTAQRFFRMEVGRDQEGRLQIDQPDAFGPDEGFVHSKLDAQTKLPRLTFWATSHIELLYSRWPEGRKAATRQRAASYLVQLLMGARIEHLDAVMPEDEHAVRPWFGDLAPIRDRTALPCGYRLARSDELPLIKLAAATQAD